MKRVLLLLLAACSDEPSGGGPNVNSVVDTYMFSATHAPEVDLLVVLDHTTAMAPYQSGLAALAADIAALADAPHAPDLRIAVTTTDAPGTLRDPSASSDAFLALGYDVHYERQPNFTGTLLDAVTQLLAVGASSTAAVRPLDTMPSTLDANPTFARADADLGILTIAASDDVSGGAIDTFVTSLEARKSDPLRVHVAGIYPAGSTRLTTFHNSFPNRNAFADITTTSFMGVLGTVATTERHVLGVPCYLEPLDLAPDIAGPQYDCDLNATYEDGTQVAVRHCSVTSGPCFEFESDGMNCMTPGHAVVKIRGFPTPYHPAIAGQCVVSAEN